MLDPSLHQQLDRLRRQEALREAEKWRLGQLVPDRRRLALRPGCWLLCQLGRLLVRWGQQLQRYAPPQAAVAPKVRNVPALLAVSRRE
ncbi:MAG: hypothetical protein JW934_23755 [Anaerolineae bacterium]|nr:hypothetical protein [Anaerolineae bacterium]